MGEVLFHRISAQVWDVNVFVLALNDRSNVVDYSEPFRNRLLSVFVFCGIVFIYAI